MKFKEKLYKHNRVYAGRIMNFFSDTVILPNKKKGFREYAEHPGAVTVLPFVDRGKIVLVKQYRHPIKKITYELPAGKIDGKENLIKCIRRELIEETGFRAKKIRKMVSFHPTGAFSTEILHIFLARDLKPVRPSPDEDEFIESLVIPFDKALRWVRTGKIKDAKTIIGLLFYDKFEKKL
ncbi:MAG: hypothetical protein AUJ85_07865 [Elusimicrobia bacterium CG1_02_37_114]|nr:MAG: hypothetical protein AUJ85_07865 [Elusimicrobia bacterium CG1_02_37_114]PIV53703.1 MAG: ADP-ribose pyrophosphatase [Elusimicrobia bacterium CG02_land_8_20_14_3_00_37_13]PIZ13205.1 MAG: ADP-ribose pyrophosphatase [Elusimicrobia bacterium CG_4_10_14_0_8_um_filter_37_32]